LLVTVRALGCARERWLRRRLAALRRPNGAAAARPYTANAAFGELETP
jgi:hypothetical protein